MRRFFIVAVLAVALLGVLAPPVTAQAPAPKVTITGTFDQVTAGGQNHIDGNLSRTKDSEWYARTRFRPDFAFEVGRTKAVLGLEIDLGYGQAGANDGGFPANTTGAGGGKSGLGTLDLNTDVAGLLEVKWIYTEFDLTGKDSLMPFIQVPTVARAGAQPFGQLGNYKVAYANGDFAGLSAVTTLAPNLKTNLAFVVVEEEVARQASNLNRGHDYAWILSADITPMKGLDLKPLYSYFHAEGATSGSARRTVSGFATLTPGVGMPEDRHTVGIDAKWRSGPFGLDPTLYYQFGTRRGICSCPVNGAPLRVGTVEATLNSWLLDIQGSYTAGPLVLEMRGIYSTGNKARDNVARDINYFEPLDLDSSYYAGWASIFALGVDYYNGGGGANASMAGNVGYDRYGRAQLGFKATYTVTPALALYGVVSPTWTAEKVDTDTGITSGGGSRSTVSSKSWAEGDSSYLGTEVNIGTTWKFAPSVAFDLSGAWLFAGDAMDTTETIASVQTKRNAQDAWLVASRVRLSF